MAGSDCGASLWSWLETTLDSGVDALLGDKDQYWLLLLSPDEVSDR